MPLIVTNLLTTEVSIARNRPTVESVENSSDRSELEYNRAFKGLTSLP